MFARICVASLLAVPASASVRGAPAPPGVRAGALVAPALPAVSISRAVPTLPAAIPAIREVSAIAPVPQAPAAGPRAIDQARAPVARMQEPGARADGGQKGALDAAFDGSQERGEARRVVDEAYAPVPADQTGNPVIIPDRLKPLLPGAGFDKATWNGRVTLHLHSVFSDGVMQPEEVVQLAYDKGVRVLSLTEHDTTASTLRAYRKAKQLGLEYHTGVEISAKGGAHVGAIDVDVTNPKLVALLARIRDARLLKATAVVAELNKHEDLRSRGIALTIEEVVAKSKHAEGGTIQRPHIARVLIDRGLVSSVQEAFDKYLKGDLYGGAGIPEDPSPREVIETIHAAGGKAILNHPYTVGENDEQAEKLARRIAELGLDGIEIYRRAPGKDEASRRKADERAARWLLVADDFDLAAAPGSDFHGDDTHLARVSVWMPNVLSDQLRARLASANAAALAVLERLERGSWEPPAPRAALLGSRGSWLDKLRARLRRLNFFA